MLNTNNIDGGVETTAQGEINPYCRSDHYRRVNTCLSTGLPNPCHMAWYRRRPMIRQQVTQRLSRALFNSEAPMLKRWQSDRQVRQTGSCKAADGREGKRGRASSTPLPRQAHTYAHILSKQNLFQRSLVQWKEKLRKPINKRIKGLFPLKASLQESLYILILTHYAVEAVRL